MLICFFKNELGYITGFQSHIKKPEKWPTEDLRKIRDADYKTLFYFLVGRNAVKEVYKKGLGVKQISTLLLKDEGDLAHGHVKIQRSVFDKKPKHIINQ